MSENTKNWQEIIDKAEVEAKSAEANAKKTEQENITDNLANAAKPVSEDHSLISEEQDELAIKLAAAEALSKKYWNDLLLHKADTENFRRRMERDLSNAHKYAVEKIALELLHVVDNLERCLESRAAVGVNGNESESATVGNEALNNVYVGVELTLKMFVDVLQKFEIKAINPVGEIFNHQSHNAMQVCEDASVAPNTVLQVVQKGYTLKDRLLRPAMVIVSK